MKTSVSILSVLLLLSNTSCKQQVQEKSTVSENEIETLINSTWKLTNIGYDYNQNNKIDANESVIKSCEKDNELAFIKNGTGIITENQLSCSGHNSTNFRWFFRNKMLTLSYTDHTEQLLSLQKNRLVFTSNNNSKGNLITEFTQQEAFVADKQCAYTKNPLAQF